MSENEERRSGLGEPGGLADLIFKPPFILLRLVLFSKFLNFSSASDALRSVGEMHLVFLLGLTSYIRLPF